MRTKSTFPGCARVTSYVIAPDGMSVTVSWDDAPTKPRRIEVAEYGDRVAVGIVVDRSVYPGFGDPGGKTVVPLRTQLADRPVYDASDGRRLLQAGPSPGAPPCPVRPERTPLEGLIAQRARYGMNTDPAFVQSLLDAKRQYTPEEQTWIDEVQRLDFESNVHDYLHGGRVYKDWGGTTLVARYPEPPSLLIRFVRRFAFHERELRRIATVPVRFARSTVRRDWFYTLPLYIEDDARAGDGFLEDFFVLKAEGDEGAQAVDVWVITRRADADAFFRTRYGGIVRVHVIGDRVECRGSYSTALA